MWWNYYTKINAIDACQISGLARKKYNDIAYKKFNSKVFKLIRRACNNGKYSVHCNVYYDYPNDVAHKTCDLLESMGYTVNISKDIYGNILGLTIERYLSDE